MSTNAADANQARSPANRLGLDYRQVPPRKLSMPIIDAHTHVKHVDWAPAFLEAADAYGIANVVSMTPLEQVDPLRAAYPGRFEFIAIPNWRDQAMTESFRTQWMKNLETFRQKGARLCKFWMAPYLRGEHGLTLDHEFVRPVVRLALDLGFEFMVHVADPSLWWDKGGKYVDTAKFGTKRDQYPQLEWFLETVAPRTVIGAHMAGYIEYPEFLQSLLDRYPHLVLDCSATKWIVREVARRPDALRDFVLRNADRILFGSDIVVDEKYDFEHYASRYWAHLTMWETPYRGESPIEDPDAPDPPRLAGVDLPENVLRRFYRENAVALKLVS